MIRKAFKMKVYPDQLEEYKRRHNPIWTELKDTLKNHGVSNYSIFYDKETNSLFGYAEVSSNKQWEEIANTPICRQWWDHMSELMETNADNSPVSIDLQEVFYMS
ncbi:L-rhamnose mutarotase [Echinicola strongylocentroti]|uniref:L-rhamnose mutarotase n=1 Tax=Echinicola strongylocentroti TaxID=1795355 RepID=A0A2Z4IP00_9BACT|nr:L-rhamnose mutarotase [Echinicola strongylocentroti]AWW32841.1 L-rhamnose mutarotase [Echinicola strongylocentroti]